MYSAFLLKLCGKSGMYFQFSRIRVFSMLAQWVLGESVNYVINVGFNYITLQNYKNIIQ